MKFDIMSYGKSLFRKRSVKNGIWLYTLQFFNMVLPLVTLPYITRILGASQYGVFSIVLNFVSYLQVVVEYGFALSATRSVALAHEKDDLSSLFTTVVCSRLVLFVICIMLTVGNILIFDRPLVTNLCFLTLSCSLIGYVLQENWIFQGKQEMKYISICTIIARSVTTLLIFFVIKSPDDILLYCILYSLSPILANLIGTTLAMRRYHLRFVKIEISDLIASLKSGMYIFFSQLSSKVFGAIGVTFLGMFASNKDVGIYSAIYKIPYVIMLLWSPIGQILYPITSKRIAASNVDGYRFIRRIKKYALAFFGVIALGIGAFAKPVTSIAFGKEYASRFYIIYPLLAWDLLGINNNFEGIQTLVGSGCDKEYSRCFQIGVVGTVLFNFIFIYTMGINGAAIAPLVSEGLLALLLHIQIKKIGKYK